MVGDIGLAHGAAAMCGPQDGPTVALSIDMEPSRSALIVSYLPDERSLYAEALRAAGFEVETCHDPESGFDRAIAMQPQAVITRIMQPGSTFDGIELARRLKEHPRMCHAAVVIVTSRIESHFRHAAEKAGCDAYFLLPCDPDELVAEIDRLLASRQTS